MTIETIDNVLEQLVLADGSKIDWGGEGSEGRAVPVGACLRAMFDPETRRIEAFDIYEIDTGSILLTLMFWPGLESAKKLAASTFDQWHKAVDEGWFDGI